TGCTRERILRVIEKPSPAPNRQRAGMLLGLVEFGDNTVGRTDRQAQVMYQGAEERVAGRPRHLLRQPAQHLRLISEIKDRGSNAAVAHRCTGAFRGLVHGQRYCGQRIGSSSEGVKLRTRLQALSPSTVKTHAAEDSG